MIKYTDGGVCAAKGFKGAGIHCGFRKNQSKKDLALIYSEAPCSAAAVYTQNLVQGAPIAVTKKHLANGTAKAVICNSGERQHLQRQRRIYSRNHLRAARKGARNLRGRHNRRLHRRYRRRNDDGAL